DVRPYWEEVIEERKKNNVKRTFRTKTLDIYEVVGENVGEEIVNECKSSKRLKCDKKGQRQTRSGRRIADNYRERTSSLSEEENNPDDEIDIFFQESSFGLQSNFIKKLEAEDSGVAHKQSLLLPSRLKCFAEAYEKMAHTRKWLLSSNKCVEDVIFNKGIKLSIESLIHSWVIDLSDPEVEKLFTGEEWREIKNEVCELPKVDENFARSLSRFRNVRTTADLKMNLLIEIITLIPNGQTCLIQYENPDEELQKEHLEGWFDADVWSIIIDCAFNSIQGLQTVRKESASVAVATRKNRNRKRTRKQRAKMGRRGDGIFRMYSDNTEYGAIEVAKKFIYQNDTKRLGDGLKLGKTIHDMLVCLARKVKFDDKKLRKLQVVGLLHSGLMLQTVRMSNPKGFISLLKREELYEVPTSVSRLRDLIMLLCDVWKAKKMVTDCMNIVKEPSPDLTEEEFLRNIIGVDMTILQKQNLADSSVKTPPPSFLPWSFDT
ncbi:22430_t:CDS:2, partial [Racocetra persica]